MKKRFVCLMLTLIMLVSLVPATALTASAAGMTISEAAITVLKKMTPFKDKCYQVGNSSEFRIGYGTVCDKNHKTAYKKGEVVFKGEAHTITQVQADKALRKQLLDLDAKVNSFASSNGLSLTQSQHDALVMFSFDAGDSWMSGSGVVKSAIVNKAGTNDLLNAMLRWANDDSTAWKRKVEVNMYKNGVYSAVVPTSFGTVTYHANGGTLAQGDTYEMSFDTTKTVSHIPAPTRAGYKFMGWYERTTVDSNGVKQPSLVPYLNSSCNGIDLYAEWQPNGVAYNSKDADFHTIVDRISQSELATSAMYLMPSDSSEIAAYNESGILKVDADFVDDSGRYWCRVSSDDKGIDHLWVRLGAAESNSGSGYTGAKLNVNVTVTNAYVNKRASDSASSALLGFYKAGDKLLIVRTNDSCTWGQVEENGAAVCWVALMYTDWSTASAGATASDSNNTTPIATATVTYNGYLNVRNEPGTDNKIVGAMSKATTANLYEIRTVNGHRWGRTDAGWICLTYTRVVMLTDKNISDTGAKDYAFTGKVVGASAKMRVEPGLNTNYTGDEPANGTAVTITNLATADNMTWGKAIWSVTENGKKVTKSGWIPMENAVSSEAPDDYAAGYVRIDPVKFTVVANELNVREGFNAAGDAFVGSGSNAISKLTKGVEVEVQLVVLYGEEIWGFVVDNVTEDGVVHGAGFINLASKYAKRSSEITIDTPSSTEDAIGTGTVVNADSVRVRMTGALYGEVLGSINRGTKVAVLAEDNGWYKIDFDVDNNPDTDSWIFGQYLEVKLGAVDNNVTTGGSNGTTQKTDGTGTGIIANTYTGVRVRSGAGIGNAVVGKLLNGTQVEILEVKTVGPGKWGRVAQGWISMDYVTMLSYNEIPGATTNETDTNKGTAVDSLANAEKTTTTAVYTGYMTDTATIYKDPNEALNEYDEASNTVREINAGENITIHELTAVTMEIYEGTKINDDGEEVEKVVRQTSYWARVNDGWIQNPAECIQLNALDEKTHTVTGAATLKVREGAGTEYDKIDTLSLGEQVPVTDLKIVEGDKKVTVWGRVETADGVVGYCDLSYMSEGALYEKKEEPTTAPTTPAPVIGSTGNTGDGGYVGKDGVKYKGKVINTTSLNVRVTPSDKAAKATTLKSGQNISIYETTINGEMAWGRCDAGWVYLYYVDLTPASGSAIDARVVYNDNTLIYTGSDGASLTGSTYAKMAVIDIYEYVGNMARTDEGWVSTANLL